MENKHQVIIIGCGPSGIGCALNLFEEGIDVVIFEKGTPGGKVNIAPRVDNYPGFKQIPGPDLAYELYKRIKAKNIPIISEEVISLTKENDLFVVKTNKDTYFSDAVYLSSGTTERKLGIPKEDEMLGHGLSYCALCDGHFFKGKDILVAGGGNSALKEAIYLSNIAHHLYLIHRRNEFRGSAKLVEELQSKDNVTILTPYVPLRIIGSDHIEGMEIKNVSDESTQIIKVEGFFPLVGQIPNTQFILIEGVKNEWNTIPVDKNMKTSVDGLYAGGDILPREIRQIYLAEHDGKIASGNIINYLKEKGDK